MVKLFFLIIVLLLCTIADFRFSGRKTAQFISWLALSIFAGLRQVGGEDYTIYKLYYNYPYLGEGYWEHGYVLLENFFNFLGFGYNPFLFIITSFSIFILVRFVYTYSKLPQLSIFIYLGTYFLFYNMVLNRQMLALAFAFLALGALIDKKQFLFYVWIIIGCFFHISIIALIPLYLLTQQLKFKFVLVSLSVIFIGLFFIGNTTSLILNAGLAAVQVEELSNKGSSYFSEGSFSVNTFEYIKIVLLFAVLWLFRKKIDKTEKVYILSLVIFALLIILFSRVEILIRVSMYYDLLTILLISSLLKKNNRHALCKIIYIGLVCLCVGIFCVRLFKFENGEFLNTELYLFNML